MDLLFRKTVLSLVALLLLAGSGAGFGVMYTSVAKAEASDLPSNGGVIEVYVWMSDDWVKAGERRFYKKPSEEELDLAQFLSPGQLAKVKLVKRGYGNGHVDVIRLGGNSPSSVNGTQAFELAKLTEKDFDVLDITDHGIVAEFDGDYQNTVLTWTARVEDRVISDIPFHFPSANNYRRITNESVFYEYNVNSNFGSLALDGSLDEVTDEQPFFKEWTVPDSGHPNGYTYGWVRNDDDYLYVALDFTPDNTMDGDKDYAAVYVKMEDGVKEFKVSVPETQWGQPFFVYSDHVGYQHKVYKFRIPLTELQSDGQLKLAFAAYGTAALGPIIPDIAYSPGNTEYLLVYNGNKYNDNISGVFAERLTSSGVQVGSSITVTQMVYGGFYDADPQAACSSVECLVIWRDDNYFDNYIMGQMLEPNGSLSGDPFPILDFSGRGDYIEDFELFFDSISSSYVISYHYYGNNHDLGIVTVSNTGVISLPFDMIEKNYIYDYQLVTDINSSRLLLVADIWENSARKLIGQYLIWNGTQYVLDNSSVDLYGDALDRFAATYDPSDGSVVIVVGGSGNSGYKVKGFSIDYGSSEVVQNKLLESDFPSINDGYYNFELIKHGSKFYLFYLQFETSWYETTQKLKWRSFQAGESLSSSFTLRSSLYGENLKISTAYHPDGKVGIFYTLTPYLLGVYQYRIPAFYSFDFQEKSVGDIYSDLDQYDSNGNDGIDIADIIKYMSSGNAYDYNGSATLDREDIQAYFYYIEPVYPLQMGE